MNTCETFAALLDAYVDGELTAEEMLRVREHLEHCEACRTYVDDALAIRAAFPDVEDTEVPEGFADRVLEAVRAKDQPIAPVKKKRNRRAMWARTALPLAACCAIVILLARGPLSGSGGGDTGNMAPRSMEQGGAAESAPAADTAAPSSAEDALTAEDAMEEPEEPQEDPAESEQKWDALTEGFSPSSALDPSDPLNAASAGPEDGAPAAYARETGGSDSANSDLPTSPSAVSQAPAEAEKPPAPAQTAGDTGTSGGAARDGGGEAPASDEELAEEEPVLDPPAISAQSAGEEGWVEYGNVVFASVVHLSKDEAGDALEGFEGRPYSNANAPESGVTGTGYALEPEDFQRILGELAVSLTPNRNPEATTELCCIVVTE